MPFTRITLRQGYSDAQIAQISDILQQSLEDEFVVPPHDRFQVFETLPATSACLIAAITAQGVARTSFSFISLRENRVHLRKRETFAGRSVNDSIRR